MALGTEHDTVTSMIVCGQSPPSALQLLFHLWQWLKIFHGTMLGPWRWEVTFAVTMAPGAASFSLRHTYPRGLSTTHQSSQPALEPSPRHLLCVGIERP